MNQLNIHASSFSPSGASVSQPQRPDSEVVQALKMNFSSFSTSALTDLYVNQCDRSLERAIDALCKIEAEMAPAVLTNNTSGLKREEGRQPLVANDDEFPALGGQPSSSNSVGWGMSPFGAVDFASKVKQSGGQSYGGGRDARAPNHRGWASQQQKSRPIWESEVGAYTQFGTGEAVSAQYSNERSDARTLALARNALFEEATRAFLAGDKKLARELSQKGRNYNQMMKQCHGNAAQLIFESRNAQQAVSASGAPIIDLHGLHVSEAQSILAKHLDDFRNKRVPQVDVVVGEGKHSKMKASPLRLGVLKYLDQAGYRYKENYSGMITVYL